MISPATYYIATKSHESLPNVIAPSFTLTPSFFSAAKGVALSFKAFLFSLNNNQGTDPKSFYLKTDRRHSAHFAKSDQGPTFGDGDLVLETMSSGYSELGNSFDIGADAAFQFAGARNFVISDVEVLTTEGNHSNMLYVP